MVMIDPERPPNFSADGRYPNSGERIGPAWAAAWRMLADGEWHSKIDLAGVMMPAGPVVMVTATNLLRSARKAKVLETRRNKRSDGGHAASDYRIKP